MALLDIEVICGEVRVLNFMRGIPAEVAMWRDDDADSRATLAIEAWRWSRTRKRCSPCCAKSAVPLALATQIVLKLLDHPDADPALAITPLTRAE